MSCFSSSASFWVSLRPLKKAVRKGERPPAWREKLLPLGLQHLLPGDQGGDGGLLIGRRPLVAQAAEHRVGGALAPLEFFPAPGHQLGGVHRSVLPKNSISFHSPSDNFSMGIPPLTGLSE